MVRRRPAGPVPAMLALAVLALAGGTAGYAQTTVYNNGGPVIDQAFEYSNGYTEADDFTFAAATTIGSATIGDLSQSNSSPNVPVDWMLYDNANGLPGNVLYSGSSLLRRTPTGSRNSNGYYEYQDAFSFTPVTLAPGTYWLGLNAPTPTQGVYWETTNPNNTYSEAYSYQGGGFVSPNFQLDFQLQSATPAPEPSSETTFTLAGLGVALMALTTRRRRKDGQIE